ncbi:WD repeat-containing protein [Acrasis kona]|uniref:WD repeat-containing protein n=1 Tax=Acrasis kona TaxID=1008807 RepID=A0AAW2YNC8_9EUKA
MSWKVFEDSKVALNYTASAISVDFTGKYVALGARRGLCVVSVDQSWERRTFYHSKRAEVGSLQFSPHASTSSYIANTLLDMIQIWDLSNASTPLLSNFKAHNRTVTGLHWSPQDTNLLATCAADSVLSLWDIRDENKTPVRQFNTGGPSQLRWNPLSSNIIASAHDGEVRIWDIRRTDTHITFITAHLSTVLSLDWSPKHEDQLVTCGQDRQIKIWSYNQPKECKLNVTTAQPVSRVRYTPFGQGLVTVSQKVDHQVRLWSLSNASEVTNINVFYGHTDVVKSFDFRQDPNKSTLHLSLLLLIMTAQLITWSKDQTLRTWSFTPNMKEDCGDQITEGLPHRSPSVNNISTSLNAEPQSPSTNNDEHLMRKKINNQQPVVTYNQECNRINDLLPQVTIESISPRSRCCIFKIETSGAKLRLQVIFPLIYPNGAHPIFELLPSKSVLTVGETKDIKQTLLTTANKHVQENQHCILACMDALLHLLGGMELPDNNEHNLQESLLPPTTATISPQNSATSPVVSINTSTSPTQSATSTTTHQQSTQQQAQQTTSTNRIMNHTPLAIDGNMFVDFNIQSPYQTTTSVYANTTNHQSPLDRHTNEQVRMLMNRPTCFGIFSPQGHLVYVNSHHSGSAPNVGAGGGAGGGPALHQNKGNNNHPIHSVLPQIRNSNDSQDYFQSIFSGYPIESPHHSSSSSSSPIIQMNKNLDSDIRSVSPCKVDTRVHIYKTDHHGMLLPISRPMAKELIATRSDGMSLKQACLHNAQVCRQHDKKATSRMWQLVAESCGSSTCSDQASSWADHPMGKRLMTRIMDKYIRMGDVQTAATLSCVLLLNQHDQPNKSWLLDVEREPLYRHVRSYYADILHMWGYDDVRGEINKFNHDHEHDEHDHDKALQCSIDLDYNKCSVCRLPVRGLNMICVMCGHGGHSHHLKFWFKNHSHCPTGCNCECVVQMTEYPYSNVASAIPTNLTNVQDESSWVNVTHMDVPVAQAASTMDTSRMVRSRSTHHGHARYHTDLPPLHTSPIKTQIPIPDQVMSAPSVNHDANMFSPMPTVQTPSTANVNSTNNATRHSSLKKNFPYFQIYQY